MSSIPCNVVLLPNPEVAEKAIALSAELTQYGVHFTLANGAFYPHASIYMLQLKAEDLPEVQNRLLQIANSIRPVHATAARYWQAKQFLDVEYEKSAEMADLQSSVVAALNPIRDGMRAKDVERMKEATGLALENYQKYGWNTVGELYRPHLTLTRFLEDQDIEQLLLPAINEFSGPFPVLGLFEMGDNGTCVRKIAEFQLGSLQ